MLLPIELTLMASLFNPNPPLVSFSSIRPSSFNPSKMVSNFNQTSIITNNTDVIAHTKLFSSSLSMATGRSSAGVDNTSRKLPVLLFDIMDTLVRDPFYDDVPAFFRCFVFTFFFFSGNYFVGKYGIRMNSKIESSIKLSWKLYGCQWFACVTLATVY